MRSTAPAIASAPPLISASLVLVGKSTASPVGAFRPAVPISSARSIRPKPGRIRPPRKRPSASRASTVTAVPTITTSAGRGAPLREHAVARADQRDPAVDAEPVRVVVAVGHAARRGADARPSAARRPRSRAAPRRGAGCPRRRRRCRACSTAPAGLPLGSRRGRRSPRGRPRRARAAAAPGCGAAYSAHLRRVLPTSMARKLMAARRLRSSCPSLAARRSR